MDHARSIQIINFHLSVEFSHLVDNLYPEGEVTSVLISRESNKFPDIIANSSKMLQQTRLSLFIVIMNN